MADKIVLLRAGVVEQVGPPLELYDRPNSTFVATFMGSPSMNLFEGATGEEGLRIFDDYAIALPEGVRADSKMTLGLRPDAISVSTAQVPGSFRATVTSLEATGSETMLFAEREGRAITVVAKERLAARPGDAVHLLPDPSQAHFFGADGRRAH